MNFISNVQQILTSTFFGCVDGSSSRVGSDSLNAAADKSLSLSSMTAAEAVVAVIESSDDESSLAIDGADVDVDFGMMLIIDFLIMAFNRLLSSVMAVCSGDTINMHDFRRHFSIILSFILYFYSVVDCLYASSCVCLLWENPTKKRGKREKNTFHTKRISSLVPKVAVYGLYFHTVSFVAQTYSSFTDAELMCSIFVFSI